MPRQHFHLFLLILSLASSLLLGCSSGSNDPIIASAAGISNGYSIRMMSSVETVPPGGTALISAAVFNPGGTPVKDGESVYFSSNIEGSFEGISDGKGQTKNGVASAIYRAPSTDANANKPAASRTNRIFASYLGALSYVEILLVSNSF